MWHSLCSFATAQLDGPVKMPVGSMQSVTEGYHNSASKAVNILQGFYSTSQSCK